MDAGNPGFQAGHSMATVLIVDDDPKLLKMLGRTLAYEGFHVHSASNGAEALSEVQARRPDVVVLDWMMPGMDGLTVLERLRALAIRPRADADARDAVENRVEGLEEADDYLVKPFAPAELLARIHALLRRPSVRARDEAIGYAGLRLDPATREVWRGGAEDRAHREGVRSTALPAAPPAPGADSGPDPAGGVGYDFGGEDNVLEVYVGYLRKKTEPGRAQADPDRARGRLLPAGRGVTSMPSDAQRPGPHGRGVSIRLRLTLLYTAILALTLVAFSSILYLAQARATYGGVESSLVRQAEEFVRRDLDDGGARPPRDADLPSGTLPGRWTQTRTIEGTILGTTVDLRGATLPLSDAGLQAVQAGNGHSETAVVDEQPVMIYSRSFAARGGETRIVQVAFPIGQSQQSLRALQLLLASGSALAILLAFLLGWVFAGTALDPIHRITRTARSIGLEHDFSKRVAYDGRGDEVGQLALTFNDMLAELESAFRQLEGSLESPKRCVADDQPRTPLTTVRGNIELLRRERLAVPPGERTSILVDKWKRWTA